MLYQPGLEHLVYNTLLTSTMNGTPLDLNQYKGTTRTSITSMKLSNRVQMHLL